MDFDESGLLCLVGVWTTPSAVPEPLRITDELLIIRYGHLQWDGRDFYRFVAYDHNSKLVRVDVTVSHVSNGQLRVGDLVRVEGKLVAGEPGTIRADVVEVTNAPQEWEAGPGDS